MISFFWSVLNASMAPCAAIVEVPEGSVGVSSVVDDDDSCASKKISGGRKVQRLSTCSGVALLMNEMVVAGVRRSGRVVKGLSAACCCCWPPDCWPPPCRERRKFCTTAEGSCEEESVALPG